MPEGHPLEFDVVVIGGGSAGLTAARLAASQGASVALVEKNRTGGECLYTGCVPTKTLLSVARRAHVARTASDFGLRVGEVTVDWPAVRAHIREVIARLTPPDTPGALEAAGVRVLRGEARFTAERTLEAGGRVVRAEAFVLATGSDPAVPTVPGLAESPHLTNETVLDLEALPEHLAILGAGPVGCEYAQAFRRLGSRVTLLEAADDILAGEDRDAARVVRAALAEDGVAVRTGARLASVSGDGEGLRLTLEGGETVAASHLLVATGRRPRVAGLGLEVIGAEFRDDGLVVDGRLRSTCPYLWGAGDVVGPGGTPGSPSALRFTHVATEHGTIAALGALGGVRRLAAGLRAGAARAEVLPWVTFTDPELAHWGLTEEEARERHGEKLEVVVFELSKLDRAVVEGEGRGFVKLLATRGALGTPLGMTLVGAHVVGRSAGEIIHEFALTRSAGFHPARLALAVHAYPTMAEAVRRASLGFFADDPAFGHKLEADEGLAGGAG